MHGIEKAYNVLCIFVAIALTSWCMYEYHLDHDVTDIMLHKFHDTPNDILPSITLCDKDPFQEYKTWFDSSGTIQKYIKLIGGSSHVRNITALNEHSQMLNSIDYDDVTVSLRDIIYEFFIEIPFNYDVMYSNRYDVVGNSLVINKAVSSIDPTHKPIEYINTYVSARDGRYKCFTFDVPMIQGRDIREIGMRFNMTQRTMGLDLAQYYFMLTFHNQTLQSRGNQIY